VFLNLEPSQQIKRTVYRTAKFLKKPLSDFTEFWTYFSKTFQFLVDDVPKTHTGTPPLDPAGGLSSPDLLRLLRPPTRILLPPPKYGTSIGGGGGGNAIIGAAISANSSFPEYLSSPALSRTSVLWELQGSVDFEET